MADKGFNKAETFGTFGAKLEFPTVKVSYDQRKLKTQ